MSGAKTEEPTSARIRRAREEGDNGASLYASQAVAFVIALALLPATVVAVAIRFEGRLREAIDQAARADVSAILDVAGVARDVAILSAPILAGVAIATTTGSLLQTAGIPRGRRRADQGPSPLARLGALASRERLFAVARALAGSAFVSWIVVRELRAHAPDIVRTSGRLAFAGPAAAAIAGSVAWKVALAGLAIGAADVVVLQALWRGRLRMSRDEVRRERRDAEGDPLMKGARDREREEGIARGGLADVRLARIVVQDEGRAACALRYEEGDRAPIVVATGERDAAEGLVRRAREHGVPVRVDAAVARALTQLPAGEPIPEALYDAVAELLRDLPE